MGPPDGIRAWVLEPNRKRGAVPRRKGVPGLVAVDEPFHIGSTNLGRGLRGDAAALLGGESPLANPTEVKNEQSTRASSRFGVCRKWERAILTNRSLVESSGRDMAPVPIPVMFQECPGGV